MKILHSADWHLGAYAGPQCDDPYKRMENTLKCLDKLVATANKEQPDLILVAGDLFHTAKVWSDRANIEIRTATEYINKLRLCAPVVILYGTPNHDSMETFKNLEYMCITDGNMYPVHFITEPLIDIFKTRSGMVQIAGLPGFDKGYFRTQFPGLSAEEENRVFSEQMKLIIDGFSAQVDPSLPSILMAHHTVVGSSLDNGQSTLYMQNEMVIEVTTLDSSNFDIVCLGHIHKAQKLLNSNKPIYYSGSIDAFTFNDEGPGKGFWIHRLEKQPNRDEWLNIGTVFFDTPARQFVTDIWDQNLVSEYLNGTAEINLEVPNPIVRILYSCDSETEKALDKKKLENDLYAAGAYYVSEIRSEKITETVNREQMHEKLTVWDCLRKYLQEKFKDNKLIDFALVIDEAFPIVNKVEASTVIGGQTGLFLPLGIEVRHYRSYAEEKLSFRDIFFAMVNGQNGAGKSSLFMDAIVDCLYEQPREGELTGWIRSGEKSGSISFTFRLGQDEYRVTRTRQRSGKATLALAVLDVTEWQDISCQKLVDTQEKIIQLLGMDANTFKSCVLIMQDQYGKFMEAKAEDRMSVLANLLGLGIYAELEEETKKALQEVNRELRQAKEEISTLDAEVAALNGLEITKNSTENDLKIAQALLITTKKDYEEASSKVAVAEQYKRELEGVRQEISKKEAQTKEKGNNLDTMLLNLKKTEEFLKNTPTLTENHLKLAELLIKHAAYKGTWTLLQDKIKLQTSIDFEHSKVTMECHKYKKELEEINTRLAACSSIKEKLSGFEDIEEKLIQEEEKIQKHAELSKDIVRLQNIIEQKQAEIRHNVKQAEMLNNSNCIDIERAQCGFLKAAKEALKTKNVLNNDILSLDKDLQEVIKKQDELLYDPESHKNIKVLANEYRALSKQIATLEGEKKTAEVYEQNIKQLEERLGILKKQESELSVEITELGKEVDKADALEDEIEKLKASEEQYNQIPQAQAYKESIIKSISDIEKTIDELGKEVVELKEKEARLQIEVNEGTRYVVTVSTLKPYIEDLEGKILTLSKELGVLEEKISSLQEKASILETKKKDIEVSASKSARLQILSEAFSQEGIPHQIIRDIVPELESAANEILSQMTGGRMRLELRTERTLKSNKGKEVATLDVVIIDVDNGELPYLSRSGGQKVRAALAVSFALAIVKASRVGLQLGMMFIDEPSFLDAEGTEGYCGALETIHSKYPDMRIIAISHDENMKARFPQQIYIETTENGSKIKKG